MDSNKSNKIREIVRLQQILRKWKKFAAINTPKNTKINNNNITKSISSSGNGSKSIKFLKKTLSFSDSSSNISSANEVVPKGFLVVCVGKELIKKRFIIPTQYLGHPAFGILLREAEEEFGFQTEGVLKIPCEVSVFEKILKMMEEKRSEVFFLPKFGFNQGDQQDMIGCCSPDCDQLTQSHHSQMCR